MTHFYQAIRFLQNTKPKSKRDKEAKRKALNILYNAEAKEKPKARRKLKRQPRKQSGSITDFIGFVSKSASDSLAKSKARREEKRLQKARTIVKIRESNLPQDVKNRELAKLHVPVYKEEHKPTEHKQEQPYGGFESARKESDA